MALVDIGIVAQNINLAATALGLNTVTRMTMNVSGIESALKVPDSVFVYLNNPIGYPVDPSDNSLKTNFSFLILIFFNIFILFCIY
jgi:nitroreductase